MAPVGKSYVLLINDHESALKRRGWDPCRHLDRRSLDCGNGIGNEQAWRGPISSPKQAPLIGLRGSTKGSFSGVQCIELGWGSLPLEVREVLGGSVSVIN